MSGRLLSITRPLVPFEDWGLGIVRDVMLWWLHSSCQWQLLWLTGLTCRERRLYGYHQAEVTMNTTFQTRAQRASDPSTPTPVELRWPRPGLDLASTPARRRPSCTRSWPTTAPSLTGSWACRRARWWSSSRWGVEAGGTWGKSTLN